MLNNDRKFIDSTGAAYATGSSRMEGGLNSRDEKGPAIADDEGFGPVAAIFDVIAIAIAAIVAGAIDQIFLAGGAWATASMIPYGVCIAALFLLFNAMQGEYSLSNYVSVDGRAWRLTLRWSMAFLCLVVVAFLIGSTAFRSHGAMIAFFVSGLGAVHFARAHLVRIAHGWARRGARVARRLVVVGYEEEVQAFTSCYDSTVAGVQIVSSAVLRRGNLQNDLSRVSAAARGLRPDDIMILVPWSQQKTIDACVEAFQALPVSIHLGPEQVLTRYSDARWSKMGPIPSLRLVRQPLSKAEVRVKRLLDIFGAGLGLILLAPLFAMIAVLIKVDSKGPVFSTQRRYGFNQEVFRLFKFRSTRVLESASNVVQATRSSAQVTRIGEWLRSTNIDELPQLINVLRGEMSLVGPRPHGLAHGKSFQQRVARYARRHNVKPGIVGWAQVNGFRGEMKCDFDIRGCVAHDLYYIDNWSIWFDLRILRMTMTSQKAYWNY